MTKVIALYNHKGGVSKTTTTFNLGWSIADLGKKVLIVDTDPQCNLTGYVLGLQHEAELESYYEKYDNIHKAISPILKGDSVSIKHVEAIATKHSNLFLAAGSISMAEMDVSLSVGMTSGGYLPYSTQFVGALNATVRETANKKGFDVVIVDMSPSAAALNRCILMGSDYFIVPTSPDYFCYQAIQSLARILPEWARDFKRFRESDVKNSLPNNPPKMLGIISQRYKQYTTEHKNIAKSFQHWIDEIQKLSYNELAYKLKKENMIITEDLFKKYIGNDSKPYNLISIPDFNSLIARSQQCSKPIFSLSPKELEQAGAVRNQQIESQQKFQGLFNQLAISITGMINE